MRKLFLPWRIFWQSVSDTWSYPNLSLTTWKIRLVTLLVWYAVFSIISTTSFAWHTLPQWRQRMVETWESTKHNWPDDLILTYNDHQLTSQPQQLLHVPYPPVFPRQEGWPQWLARFDTRDQPQILTDSLLFITTESVYTNANSQQSAPLSELLGDQTWQLNRSVLIEADEKIYALIGDVEIILLIARALLAWIPLLVIRLLGLLLYAWIGQTAFSLMGTQLSYKRMYAVGMIALLPAEAVQTITNIIYPDTLPLFWWAWLAITGLVGWLNRSRWSK